MFTFKTFNCSHKLCLPINLGTNNSSANLWRTLHHPFMLMCVYDWSAIGLAECKCAVVRCAYLFIRINVTSAAEDGDSLINTMHAWNDLLIQVTKSSPSISIIPNAPSCSCNAANIYINNIVSVLWASVFDMFIINTIDELSYKNTPPAGLSVGQNARCAVCAWICAYWFWPNLRLRTGFAASTLVLFVLIAFPTSEFEYLYACALFALNFYELIFMLITGISNANEHRRTAAQQVSGDAYSGCLHVYFMYSWCSQVDFCANNPCPEGHRCNDRGDDYTCECPGGRNGPDCNQVPRTVSPLLRCCRRRRLEVCVCVCVSVFVSVSCTLWFPFMRRHCDDDNRCAQKCRLLLCLLRAGTSTSTFRYVYNVMRCYMCIKCAHCDILRIVWQCVCIHIQWLRSSGPLSQRDTSASPIARPICTLALYSHYTRECVDKHAYFVNISTEI